MPARARTSGRVRVRSLPSKRMRPERGWSKPMMLLSRVVFPTPLRPMRQTTSPADTCMSTWRRICVSPYDTESCSISSICLAILSQIDFDHFGIALHVANRALAENFTLVQDGYLHGDLPHERHVVVDDQQRVPARHRHQQFP